jgi:hypothetical protein
MAVRTTPSVLAGNGILAARDNAQGRPGTC